MTKAFVDALENVTHTAGVRGVLDRLGRPVSVEVTGRDGVGRGCVTAALRRRGITVCDDGDVRVLVVAEVAKAEDLARARATRRPVLIVLTKADLVGSGPEGPMAEARRRAADIRRATGVRAVAVVGLLAALTSAGDLADELVVALRRFVAEPPDVSSVDAFVDGPHPVDRAVRHRLLATLDRFGIAHAVLALEGGCGPDRLSDHLAGVGGVAAVMAALDAVAAPVRYRRIHGAIAELHCLAAQSDDSRLADLLRADVTAMAAMSAAVDVVTAAGASVDADDSATAHLARAVTWRDYGRGPVGALHRQCSADIVRGSLRLWEGRRW